MSERSQRDDVQLAPTQRQEQARETEGPAKERYVAGHTPDVATTAEAGKPDRSASQLAFEEDGNTRELKGKVSALVGSKFGGDYHKAFDHYDADKDGSVDKGELMQLLSDAGVGNGMTRGAWAKGIIEKMDGNGDSKIQFGEFSSAVGGSATA